MKDPEPTGVFLAGFDLLAGYKMMFARIKAAI